MSHLLVPCSNAISKRQEECRGASTGVVQLFSLCQYYFQSRNLCRNSKVSRFNLSKILKPPNLASSGVKSVGPDTKSCYIGHYQTYRKENWWPLNRRLNQGTAIKTTNSHTTVQLRPLIYLALSHVSGPVKASPLCREFFKENTT